LGLCPPGCTPVYHPDYPEGPPDCICNSGVDASQGGGTKCYYGNYNTGVLVEIPCDFFQLGLALPGESFEECVARNANTYSFAGLTDLILGANGKISESLLGQAALGNTFTALYYSFAGNNTTPNQLATLGGSIPSIVSIAMGSPLTFGRRTTDIMSLNLAGKGGVPHALSSASGGLKSFLNSIGTFKLAADAAFTIALLLGCLGPA